MTQRPLVAVLVPDWESRSEEGWITRQVAGALAGAAEVHIITPGGTLASTSIDGVFTLHRLGRPIEESAELRRDLLAKSISQAAPGDAAPLPPDLGALLDRDLLEPWHGAVAILADLQPDRVLIAGHRNVGALTAVDQHDPQLGVSLLALGVDPDLLAFPHFDQLYQRADAVLAVTETERTAIVEHLGSSDKVHRIGGPLSANPSALTEPNTWVGASQYLLVLTSVAEDDDHRQNDLARLLRVRFPHHPIGISHTDAFCAWHHGQVSRGWPIEKSSDLDRLLAWARFTVDLHPGPFFARRCVTSLLYGTPLIVPEDSRAQEHAQRGQGGLWFASPSELGWCAEALLQPSTRDALSTQGRAYAEEEYGSTDAFIARVVNACGLTPAATTPAVTA
jgi:hypothetical protein